MHWILASWNPCKHDPRNLKRGIGRLLHGSFVSRSWHRGRSWLHILQGLTWAWPAGFHDQHQSTCQPNPRTRSRSLTYQVHLPRVLVQHLMIRVTPMLPKRENVVASRGQWRVTHGIFPPGTESRHPGHTWRRCMTWHLTPQWSYHHWSRGMNAVVSLPWPWQGLQRGSYNLLHAPMTICKLLHFARCQCSIF